MAPLIQALTVLSTLATLATIPTVIIAQNVSADGPSPYGTGFAPDVTVVTPNIHNFIVPASEGELVPGLELDNNGTLDESGPEFSQFWGVDRRAAEFYLRIMPLGASITQGYRSSDNNGYRKHIRDQLRFDGWQVNMVGSLQDGSMSDRDHEGHGGYIISQVHDAFAQVKSMKPNLVLLNVGTNDCVGNVDITNAGTRLKALIDDVYASIPGVTVIISSVVPSANTGTCPAVVSAQYKALYQNYRAAGARVGFADMNTALTLADLGADGTHPSDAGYLKMASVWWAAFQTIESGLQAPDANAMNDATQTTSATCAKVAGNAPPAVQIQRGSGADDGGYVHKSISHGIIQTVAKGDNARIAASIPSHIFFAQLVNVYGVDRSESLDEMIRIVHGDDGINTYWFRLNNGGGSFNAPVTFDVGMDCNLGPTYYFADFNNDGLDDFWCLGTNSEVHVSLNRGGNPPVFESIGLVVGTHDGYVAADVRIADIDGDGRADYCLVTSSGSVICSRNGGQGDSWYWQGFSTPDGIRGEVIAGQGKPNNAGVFIGDLNGDYKADYMYIGDTGQISTLINQRGWTAQPGIVPNWVDAGVTHAGMGTPGVQSLIKFGRIYGSGRLDYIYLKNESDRWDAYMWENIGTGGTKVKGDGVFYCDMRGTGSDDYVWIYNDGQTATIYENIHDPPYWGQNAQNLFSVPGPRVGIHLADWDGDGKCDVLTQDKATGALHMWKNNYDPLTDKFSFTDEGIVSGDATCTEGWGVSIFDRGLRLADIDGDGRADYLCIEPNGRVTGWLNPITGLHNVGQVKYSEGWDRANMRFADVEKSGRHDLIHLDKYSGAATVFKNLGPTPVSGSAFTWGNRGVLYAPIDRGQNMHFANFGGLGRADLVHVLPITNRAWVYWNQCGSSSGGDDGPIVDPGLPAYTVPGDGTGDCTSNCGAVTTPSGTDWEGVTCSDPSVTNAANNPWNGTYSDQAWKAAIVDWQSSAEYPLSFPEGVSNFFHGPPNFACDVLQDSNPCASSVKCDNIKPAGYVILNAFDTIYNAMSNLHSGILNAGNDIDKQIGLLASTFAPIPKESFGEKLALDILALGFALVASPFWNNFFKRLDAFKGSAGGNLLGTLKDWVNPLVSNSVTIIKDSITAGGDDLLGVENEVDVQLAEIVKQWQTAVTVMDSYIFNGSDDAVRVLYNVLQDGKMWETEVTQISGDDIEAMCETALFATLIPMTWQLSTQDLSPVVISTGAACGTTPDMKYISDSNVADNSFCVGNEIYILMGASGAPQACPIVNREIECTPNKFKTLPGMSQITGSNNFGGVTAQDIVTSAVNGYVGNNNANNWPLYDPVAVDNDVSTLSPTSAGVVQLPVCSETEAHANWDLYDQSSAKRPAAYPCN